MIAFRRMIVGVRPSPGAAGLTLDSTSRDVAQLAWVERRGLGETVVGFFVETGAFDGDRI